jgi:hypothetical protein
MNWEALNKFVDIDRLTVDFLHVTSDITSVDREWGEEVIFNYYRKNGFPHYQINDFEKHEHIKGLQEFDERSIFKDGKLDQTMHALRLAWSYFPHHWEVRCGSSPSPLEAFNDDVILKKVIRKTWDWVLKHQDNNQFTENRFRQNLKVYGASQSVSNFRPSVAKWIYNTYGNGGVVWDMSMGWGGRLLGFLASNCHTYIGTEPSTKTFDGLVEMKKDFEYVGKNVILHHMGSEELEVERETLDLCFTSPPYFDTEKYSDEETQSYKKYPTKNEWADGFLYKTFTNCWNGLKEDGAMIINIADTPTNKWIESETIRIANSIGFNHIDTLYLVLSSISGKGQKLEPMFVFKKQ